MRSRAMRLDGTARVRHHRPTMRATYFFGWFSGAGLSPGAVTCRT